MPESGNYGTPGNPQEIWSSYWELQWYTGSDPSHVQGDVWGRSDVAPGDSIATVRIDHYQNSGVWDVPVFPTGTAQGNVEEVLRIPTPNGRGFLPVLQTAPAFRQVAYYHNSTRYDLHRNQAPGVSRWDFEDESDTSTFIDSWADNDGAINGATYSTTAQVNSYSLSFNGSSDNAEVPHDSSLNLGGQGGDFTITLWVRCNSLSDSQFFLTKNNDNDDQTDPAKLEINNGDGTVNWIVDSSSSGASWTRLSAGTISTGTWVHLAFVYNSGSRTTYQDGSQQNTDTLTDADYSTSAPLTLGCRFDNNGTPTTHYDGYLDSVRIYPDALSGTAIQEIYTEETP